MFTADNYLALFPCWSLESLCFIRSLGFSGLFDSWMEKVLSNESLYGVSCSPWIQVVLTLRNRLCVSLHSQAGPFSPESRFLTSLLIISFSLVGLVVAVVQFLLMVYDQLEFPLELAGDGLQLEAVSHLGRGYQLVLWHFVLLHRNPLCQIQEVV